MKFPPNYGSGSGGEASSSSVLGKRRRVGLVYDERMCKHATPAKREVHPENPDRIRSIWNKLLSAGIPQKCVVFNAKEVEDRYVAAVHTTNHINLIKTISSKKPASQRNKVARKYNSIYFNEGSSECACLAAGSVLEVAEKVAKGELNSAFAIVRPPGHHAEENEPMGFCLYNNVAIAARFLLNQKELGVNKILIVDWDVHPGNGTQKMFWKDSRVLFFSVHRHDNGEFYPASDDGSHIMMGEGPGLGYNINVPWESGQRGDADYFAVWDHILVPVAKEFNPDIIIISAGFDAAVGDPLGGCLVTPHGYSIMLKKLMEFSRGKIIMALEGGYNLNSIANSVLACVQVLLEDKPIVESMSVDPFESTWRVIKVVREQFSAFWPTIFNQVAENQNLTIAHGKAADNDENTLLETSKEDNEEEDEFMDVDIEIISTSENLPFTSSLQAHCEAANNDEDTLLETSAKGNEEEEEFIDENIQINTTFENLQLTSSPTAHSKAANNDEDTLLETSAEGNEDKEEFIDEDIQINPTSVSHPFTSSPLAHCEAVHNDEDTLLETSAKGNEEEFIKEDIQINPTFENLSLTSSPPTHCKAANNDEVTLLETSAEGNEKEEELIDEDNQINPTSENLPLTSSPPAHCKAANNDEDILLETSVEGNEEVFIDEDIQINPTSANLPLTSSPAANNDEDTLQESSAEDSEGDAETESVSLKRKMKSHVETPSKQMKRVNSSSRVVNETSAKDPSLALLDSFNFVPAWSSRDDDPCTEDKSIRDFLDRVVPPALADATHKMSNSELLARGDRANFEMTTYYCMMCQRLYDANDVSSELKYKVQFLERLASVDAKVIQDLRKQLDIGAKPIKVHVQEERDRRAREEAECSKLVEKNKELVEELTSLIASMQALTDRLAKKETEVLEFEQLKHLSDKVRDLEGVVLTRDIELAAARSQIESLQAVLHDSKADRDAAKHEKRDLDSRQLLIHDQFLY